MPPLRQELNRKENLKNNEPSLTLFFGMRADGVGCLILTKAIDPNDERAAP
jgi:hypothetical protein